MRGGIRKERLRQVVGCGVALAVLISGVPARADETVPGRMGEEVGRLAAAGVQHAGESPAAVEGKHWAWIPAQALVDAGIGGEELRAALAAPRGLERPIAPLEWDAYVARAVGEEPGRGETGDKRYWLYAYTAEEGGGGRSVVSRGYAAAGLAKIGNMYGFMPGSGGPLEHLPRFPDWRWLDEKGYAGPCEHMAAAGLLSGYPDGTLRPERPLSRGEAAALLKGWLELREKVQKAGVSGAAALRPPG